MAAIEYTVPTQICPYADLYTKWADTYDLPWYILAAQDWVESKHNPKSVGSKGEKGLGQFLPSTWQEWGKGDPFDPDVNIQAHCRYLIWLKGVLARNDRTEWTWTIAAYNCGIGRALSAKTWDDLPLSTRNYTSKVIEKAIDYLTGAISLSYLKLYQK